MILYTLLKQDGTTEELLQTDKEVELAQLYEWLNCTTVEIIPETYYQPEWFTEGTETLVWGDEMGRFNSNNHRNPHTQAFREWDCVGDLVLQQEV